MGQLDAINPIGRLGKVLQNAGGSPSPSPSPLPSPSPAARTASGDIELPAERRISTQVSWVGSTGKRMSGTAAERDADLAKKKSPIVSRSMRK